MDWKGSTPIRADSAQTQVNISDSSIGQMIFNENKPDDPKRRPLQADGVDEFVEGAATNDDYYPLRRASKILIISNDNSDRNPLPGYRNDASNLKKMWESFGCEVELHENARYDNMRMYLTKFANDVSTGEGTFCGVFILSHGGYKEDIGDLVFGADEGVQGFLSVDDIIKLFDNKNENLQEIPKLFIFQCCRGKNKPQAVQKGATAANIASPNEKLPQISDVLVMHATQLKDVAVVDDDGSWLIKDILHVFQERYETEHVADMLTMVNRAIAKRIVHAARDSRLVGVKCMSEIRSTLRRKLRISKK